MIGTSAPDQAREIVLAEHARDMTPDFRRVADRLFSAVSDAVTACNCPAETERELAVQRHAQERAETLRALADALATITSIYAYVQNDAASGVCYP